MRFSVTTYSFANLYQGRTDQMDCIKKARDMGFDAIEFAEILAPEGRRLSEYADELAAECKACGLPVSCLAFGADFLKPDLAAELDWVKTMVDMAARLGTNIIRHDAAYGSDQPFETVLPRIADACRQVTEYAAAKGIRTTVENHGFFCQGGLRMEKLYTAVDHPNFGLLSDMGNFLCSDDDPAIAFGIVAPYTIYVHAKDFHIKPAMHPDPGRGFFRSRNGNYLRGAILGHGNVPVKHCLDALKIAGYDGYVSLEFEGMENAESAIAIGLENLKKYV